MPSTGFNRVGIGSSFHAIDIIAPAAATPSITLPVRNLQSLYRVELNATVTEYTVNLPAALTLQNVSLDEIRITFAVHFSTAGQTFVISLPVLTDSWFCYGGNTITLTAAADDECQAVTIQSPPRVIFDNVSSTELSPTEWTVQSCCDAAISSELVPPPPAPAVGFASFFGMPAGPGNTGVDDYPATIAASAAGPSVAGLSAINFPRASAPAVGGIVINNPGVAQTDNTEFVLPTVGTYRATWHISVDEPAQWSLWIGTLSGQAAGGTFSPHIVAAGTPSTVGQAGLTAQLVGDVVFVTPFANAVIQVRNFAASGGTVTVTPLPGGTQAQAVVLIIERLA